MIQYPNLDHFTAPTELLQEEVQLPVTTPPDRNSLWALLALLGMVFGSLYIQFQHLLLSDPLMLAIGKLQDDSYYYLEPAWKLKIHGFYTFDGIHSTYGFQPLWMVLLSVLALFTSDKMHFLVLSLCLSSVLFTATGASLYFLSRKWFSSWLSLIAPALWLFNYLVFWNFVSGKENALAALVLVWLTISLYNSLSKNASSRHFWITGALCGLAVLARVNFVVFAAIVLIAIISSPNFNIKRRLRNAFLMCLAAGSLCFPWFLYALFSFGTFMPVSGSIKLAKGLNTDWLISLREYVKTDIPNWSLSSMIFMPRQVYSLLIIAFIWLLFASVYRVAKSKSTGKVIHEHFPLALLLLFALVNAILSCLFLKPYLQYATWYAVPEMISCVLLASLAVGLILKYQPTSPLIYLCAFIFLGLRFKSSLMPQPYFRPPKTTWGYEMVDGARWIDKHLPAGTKVGCHNAGLIGFMTHKVQIINLDGLANSPDYFKNVLQPKKMREYLKAEHIYYYIDGIPKTTLQKKQPLFGAIPENRYEMIYKGKTFFCYPHSLQFAVFKINPY